MAFRAGPVVGGVVAAVVTVAVLTMAGREAATAQPAPQCAVAGRVAGPGAGLAWVPPGQVTLGEHARYPEEAPPLDVEMAGFWIAVTEVTNAEFAAFVRATGHVSEAERQPEQLGGPGSAVFGAGGNPGWTYVAGASWRRPHGKGSNLDGMADHPAVHVTHEDAVAYARWKGHVLPTEAQLEYAARAGGSIAQAQSADGRALWLANVWQGVFPVVNEGTDGFATTAPVGCFPANQLGVHDLIGNVWEWTDTPWYPTRTPAPADIAAYPEGYAPGRARVGARVIKGGSYLCAANFCSRYRPDARQPQERDLSASHIGFRTVVNAPGPAPSTKR